MLDDNLPTYRLQQSSENPQNTLLYFTHNGSEPSAEYVLKRPSPSESRNQYALGLLDVNYSSVIYAEVLVKPEWTQPSLSAAELRAQNGVSTPIAMTPAAFDVLLYNPDQSITVKRNHGSWNKSDTWDFEVPERSFKLPSSSQIDKDTTPVLTELAPKVVFRWRKDGRLSKDMTCYMSGRSVGGKKSKEPDITVALFRAGKSESAVTIYEPNMARVDVEDRKGLEVALILSAEVVRDLYLIPRHDPFNTAGGPGPATSKTSRPTGSPQQNMPMASGALGLGISPSPVANSSPGPSVKQSDVDAETKRIQAMVDEENRQARERERRDQEEQNRIRRMLENEETDRRRRDAEIEQETERLRKQYGVQAPNGNPQAHSPALPPRPGQNQYYASGGLGWEQPPMPPRPNSAGIPQQQQDTSNSGGKKKSSNPLGALLGPYSGPSGASVSGFFHRSEEDKRKKVEKKRSVHF